MSTDSIKKVKRDADFYAVLFNTPGYETTETKTLNILNEFADRLNQFRGFNRAHQDGLELEIVKIQSIIDNSGLGVGNLGVFQAQFASISKFLENHPDIQVVKDSGAGFSATVRFSSAAPDRGAGIVPGICKFLDGSGSFSGSNGLERPETPYRSRGGKEEVEEDPLPTGLAGKAEKGEEQSKHFPELKDLVEDMQSEDLALFQSRILSFPEDHFNEDEKIWLLMRAIDIESYEPLLFLLENSHFTAMGLEAFDRLQTYFITKNKKESLHYNIFIGRKEACFSGFGRELKEDEKIKVMKKLIDSNDKAGLSAKFREVQFGMMELKSFDELISYAKGKPYLQIILESKKMEREGFEVPDKKPDLDSIGLSVILEMIKGREDLTEKDKTEVVERCIDLEVDIDTFTQLICYDVRFSSMNFDPLIDYATKKNRTPYAAMLVYAKNNNV